MRDYYVILKGSNKDLAISEIETLFNLYHNQNLEISEVRNILYNFRLEDIDLDSNFLRRLTLTNYIGKEIFSFNNIKDFERKLEDNIDIITELTNNSSFVVRSRKFKNSFKSEISEKNIGRIIWDNLENSKVDLVNPDIEFTLIVSDNKFSLCQRVYFNDKDYLRRMPKLRPIQMPYTLKSDMARVCVNLLNLKEGVVLDPFCGIGGILLEAYDMGFEVIGNDISWNDLKYMKINFDHFYPNSNVMRVLADSRTQFLSNNSVDGIVSDIPYGKASRRLGLELYERFLINSKNMLKPGARIVIVYANFVEFRDIALKYFNEIKQIDQYINRSMTRHIIILENTK